MAKSMAKLENGCVTNIIWCSDNQQETDVLKNIYNFPITINDTWENGVFLREGKKILTFEEEEENKNEKLIAELIEIIYQNDMEVIG